MMGWKGSSRTPIGLEVGAKTVKAVQLSGAPGRWRVEAVYQTDRNDPGQKLDVAEAAQICEVLAKHGFMGRRLVIATGQDQQLISHLELPPRTSQAPLEHIAHHELSRMNRVEPQAIESACWDLPPPARAGAATHVMAVACSHESADAVLDLFEGQGYTVEALDVQACALARACGPWIPEVGALGLILDIGWKAARLIVVHEGVVAYYRVLGDGGIKPLAEKIEAQLDMDIAAAVERVEAEGLGHHPPSRADLAGQDTGTVRAVVADHFDAVAEELRISFAYMLHRYPSVAVNQLLLVGGAARMTGLADFLTEVLEIKVLEPQWDGMAGVSASFGWPWSGLASAVGLAQHPDG